MGEREDPASLRSSHTRVLLAGGLAAGLTTAGMLLGAGGAFADEGSDSPDMAQSAQVDGSSEAAPVGDDAGASNTGAAGGAGAKGGGGAAGKNGPHRGGGGAGRNAARAQSKAAGNGAAGNGAGRTQQAAATDTPSETQTATTPTLAGATVAWQNVDGKRVTDYSSNGQQTLRTFEQPTGDVVAVTANADGTQNRVVNRTDGTRVEQKTNAAGLTRSVVYNADGTVRNRNRKQGTPPPVPPVAPPVTTGPQGEWTETDPNAALVAVTAGPVATTATTQRTDGGQESRQYNPDGSYTSTVTYQDGKIVRTAIDETGLQSTKVYRNGELVRQSTRQAGPHTPPTAPTADQIAQASAAVYVTDAGEKAVQNTLVDAAVTDAKITNGGVDVRRTVAENGAGLTTRNNGATTTYRQVGPDGSTVVRVVDNATGEIQSTRRLAGEAPAPIVLPTYVQDDPTPVVTESTTPNGQPAVMTVWKNGTVLNQKTTPGGGEWIQTQLPTGLNTIARHDVNGDKVTIQAGPTGPVKLFTRDSTGVGVKQDLPEVLANLPVDAVEVGAEKGAFGNVQVTGRKPGSEAVAFDWGRNHVQVSTDPKGDLTWAQDANADLRATLNPKPTEGEPVAEPVDWDKWSVQRVVDTDGLASRTEQRVGNDGKVRSDGSYVVADNGDTDSSWNVRDADGKQLTSVKVGVDGSVHQVNDLNPDFGPEYRSVYNRDNAGNVSSLLKWDESDINNGVTEFRTRQLVDGDGFVRYGRQGPDEDAMRIVFTDATGRFVDGRPTLTAEERAKALQDGFVITDASAVKQGQGWRRGKDGLILVPAWATDGQLAVPPAGGYANGTGPTDTGEAAAALPGAPSAAYSTVAQWLANRVGEGFGLDGLGKETLVDAAGGVVGLIAGDKGALRNAGASLAGNAVDGIARDALPGDLGFLGSAAGNVVGTVIAGGDVDPGSLISSAGQEILTNLAGTAAGYAGGGVLNLAGKAIFGGEVTGTDVLDQTIATGAGVACSAAGTPILGAACYGLASFLTGLFGSKPADLATNFSRDYRDHATRTANPLSNAVEDARNGVDPTDPLWTADYNKNLAYDLEFAPDQAGTLTRQAYLAASAPNRTTAPEAQRREDFGKLAQALAKDTPEMGEFADYLQASAVYAQRAQGKDDSWHQRNFDRAASKLGYAEALDVTPVDPGTMTVAQARAIVDASGARLGKGVVDPLADQRANLDTLPDLDQLSHDKAQQEVDGYVANPGTDGESGQTVAPTRYSGPWWQDFYRAQMLADSKGVADVVPDGFDDRSGRSIKRMSDKSVYQDYLFPSYIGSDAEDDPARTVYEDRQNGIKTAVDLIRRHGGIGDPRVAAQLINDSKAGKASPVYFAPKTAPLLGREGPGDIPGAAAGIVTSFADAVQSLRPARTTASASPALNGGLTTLDGLDLTQPTAPN